MPDCAGRALPAKAGRPMYAPMMPYVPPRACSNFSLVVNPCLLSPWLSVYGRLDATLLLIETPPKVISSKSSFYLSLLLALCCSYSSLSADLLSPPPFTRWLPALPEKILIGMILAVQLNLYRWWCLFLIRFTARSLPPPYAFMHFP